MAGIDPYLVATLPTASSPAAQVLLDVATLNRVEGTKDGELTLRICA